MQKKKTYVTPAVNVVEIESEKILCLSPNGETPFTNGVDW